MTRRQFLNTTVSADPSISEATFLNVIMSHVSRHFLLHPPYNLLTLLLILVWRVESVRQQQITDEGYTQTPVARVILIGQPSYEWDGAMFYSHVPTREQSVRRRTDCSYALSTAK